MPSLKPPQGWRYLKARLRLLNRPQALGTIAVLLVSGGVLMNYWRRQPAPSPAPSLPAASAPALSPAAPLPTLEQPGSDAQRAGSEPSTPPTLPTRTEAIASPSSTPASPLDLGLVSPSVLPPPDRPAASAPRSSIDRFPSSLPNLESLSPVSPASPPAPPAPPADPLRSAIANPAPIAPAVTSRSTEPWRSMGNPATPYITSPPPGTTGYILPPTLAPSPSGLPASRPEVTGVAPPTSTMPGFPAAPVPNSQRRPGQPIGSNPANSLTNPSFTNP